MRKDKTIICKEYRFALAGNPNSGKTTLFNELTGSHYQVGNWPGVTVEHKEGICKYVYHKHPSRFDTHEHHSAHRNDEEHNHIKIIDLPGIYSLSPNSAEEVITRDYIINEKPDLILNIVDATNLERNLYLTTQLAEMNLPMIIALNMMDALEANGVSIDVDKLEDRLGIPIIPISASKGRGIQDLINEALNIAVEEKSAHQAVVYPSELEKYIREIEKIQGSMCLSAIKALERDKLILKNTTNGEILNIVKKAEKELGDIETLVAEARYAFIERTIKECTEKTGDNKQYTIMEKIDSVVEHHLLAIPIFVAVMFLIFQITFGPVGSFLSDGVDMLINEKLSGVLLAWLERLDTSQFLISLIIDGILAGVGGVITFFPQIMLLFLFLSFLEDSGYMARAAFIVDRLFVRLGLSGKSFVPMIMGFGCTVPAVMAARTLENERDRRLTILLMPFMSCGAKMPVYAIFAGALFQKQAGVVIFSLYLLGILLASISGFIFSKTVLKGETPPFVLELPPYRMPTFKSTFHHMWEKAKDFAIRAGTVLLMASIIIWFLQNFDFHLRMVDDSGESMLGIIGHFIAPVFTLSGFGNWKAAVSLLSGFAAKEAVVSTMGILYNAPDTDSLMSVIGGTFSPLAAYSFLVFVLLYVPCIAAVSAIKSEMNSWKWALFSVFYQVAVAWVISVLVYQIGSVFI
ncbi:MAG: ferrous iron transport protein B [Clostridia bacterium]|nr:ferrous iron transport protein B [Clostridia bacterium]